MSERQHEAAVQRIHSGIASGDYYQVNLTTRLSASATDPEPWYCRLAAAQRGAYNAYVCTGDALGPMQTADFRPVLH